MKVINSNRRYLKNSTGTKVPFNFRKFYCTCCDSYHSEIPDFVTPYHQYEQVVIDKVRKGDISTFGIDTSTLRYWQGKKGSKSHH